jgi:hypothetical protein
MCVEEIEDGAQYFDPTKHDDEMLMNRIIFETSEHAESTGHRATGRVIVMNRGAQFRRPEKPKYTRLVESQPQHHARGGDDSTAQIADERQRKEKMRQMEQQNRALRAQLWAMQTSPQY